MQTYKGSCHCGAVAFEIDTDLSESVKCNCSLCTKKNALMTMVHENQFRILKGEDKLGLYEWNSGVAKHHFCNECGIYTFHRRRSSPEHFAINVHCLDDANASGISIVEINGRETPLISDVK